MLTISRVDVNLPTSDSHGVLVARLQLLVFYIHQAFGDGEIQEDEIIVIDSDTE